MVRPLPGCSDGDGDAGVDVYQCKTLYIKDLDTPYRNYSSRNQEPVPQSHKHVTAKSNDPNVSYQLHRPNTSQHLGRPYMGLFGQLV